MYSRSAAHHRSDALSARYADRFAAHSLLGDDPASILHTTSNLRHRHRGTSLPLAAWDQRTALASHLTPLIGERAQPVAQLLIERFGTLARVLNASPISLTSALAEYPGVVEVICAACELVMSAINERLVGTCVEPTDPALHRYLRTKMLDPQEERMHAIFLDRDGFYLASETIARGTKNRLVIRLRDLMHRALDCGAAGLILAHNHPSGSSQPSDEDVISTERLTAIFSALELELVDHLIVSTAGIYSLRCGRML